MKRRVALECLGDCSHSRHVLAVVRECIVCQTVAMRQIVSAVASGGADSVNNSQSRPSGRFDSICGALEIRDGRVEFECPRQVLCAL